MQRETSFGFLHAYSRVAGGSMRISTRALLVVAAVAAVSALVACMPGPNPFTPGPVVGQSPAGFWLGLWHGIIVWVTFVVSLFDHSVSVYEVHNSGWPYNLGFVIGAATLHGGGGAASRRRKSPPRKPDETDRSNP
jgi:hypothetical protein